MQVLVGTPNDDEMIGAYTSEVLVGGAGADTLCGGLGNDTVDYSSSTLPVRVTLDGDMPTDPDLGIQLLPDHSGESGEALRQRFFSARHECRQTNPADGLPVTPGDRDCTADDGPFNPVTGVSTDNDCVGEDVENIIGSDSDDILIGNDIDPLEGRGPRVEPLGANRIEGRWRQRRHGRSRRPGRVRGRRGHGHGHLRWIRGGRPQFSGRTRPVNVTIDGVANDGGVADRNRAGLTDSVNTDVERIVGGSADDVLRGDDDDPTTPEDEGADILLGGDGIDFLAGNGGADRLEGQAGSDRALRGGPGNDLLLGGDGDEADATPADRNPVLRGGGGTTASTVRRATTRSPATRAPTR